MSNKDDYKTKLIGRWEASNDPIIEEQRDIVRDLENVFGDIDLFGDEFECDYKGEKVWPKGES